MDAEDFDMNSALAGITAFDRSAISLIRRQEHDALGVMVETAEQATDSQLKRDGLRELDRFKTIL